GGSDRNIAPARILQACRTASQGSRDLGAPSRVHGEANDSRGRGRATARVSGARTLARTSQESRGTQSRVPQGSLAHRQLESRTDPARSDLAAAPGIQCSAGAEGAWTQVRCERG